VPRKIKNKIIIIRGIILKKKLFLKKINPLKNLKKIIFPYSPKNNNAKPILLYSVLKPDTNSLSPSAKSKGWRLVSATIVINQKIIIGKNKKKEKKYFFFIFFILKEFEIQQGKKINVNNPISYEIIWAPPRSLPKKENFEFLPQPENKIV